MDAHQRCSKFRRKMANFENNGFFRFAGTNAFKTKDPEMSKATGEVGFRNFVELEFRVHILL